MLTTFPLIEITIPANSQKNLNKNIVGISPLRTAPHERIYCRCEDRTINHAKAAVRGDSYLPLVGLASASPASIVACVAGANSSVATGSYKHRTGYYSHTPVISRINAGLRQRYQRWCYWPRRWRALCARMTVSAPYELLR